MSGQNGDKARFHRIRKQKIARRTHARELVKDTTSQTKRMDSSASSKPERVSA